MCCRSCGNCKVNCGGEDVHRGIAKAKVEKDSIVGKFGTVVALYPTINIKDEKRNEKYFKENCIGISRDTDMVNNSHYYL